MRLFDTHAHLNDESFEEVRADVIGRARTAGVERIICVGTCGASSNRCVQIAGEFDCVVAAVGIQPNYVSEVPANDWDTILSLVKQKKVVAIGETGLDRYWDRAPFSLQQEFFDRHLRLSQETRLPFIVHMRECESDIISMLNEASARGPVNGVMHSFTGTLQGMRECVAMGLHISFAGMVTYKKSDELRGIAAEVPIDRLLIETDCPYLSPHPYRSKRPNEPSLLIHTATCIAEARGMSVESLAEICTQNAIRLFLERA